jgi:hypothetical protein
MRLELPIKPRGSCFLCSHAEKIRTCVTGETVMLFPIVVVTVAMISVPMIAVTVVTVAGFEWPTPTHRPIFSIRDLKSKLGM